MQQLVGAVLCKARRCTRALNQKCKHHYYSFRVIRRGGEKTPLLDRGGITFSCLTEVLPLSGNVCTEQPITEQVVSQSLPSSVALPTSAKAKGNFKEKI